ncbi:protein-L-isoaspartate O-methyltransferase family protein [Streptomyces sp. 6N106]|uniref:protein-L-isoaspartate O-methyltransferase family protein n=1 Tax=Streptomyces sp. 6N106 TaxID=3457418 RepID=UPI003FD236C1
MMLQQLDVRPGQRVLEIGAGTGYNAALLARLTGDDGRVTTVDIDPKVTGRAAKALQATGYGHVHVATGADTTERDVVRHRAEGDDYERPHDGDGAVEQGRADAAGAEYRGAGRNAGQGDPQHHLPTPGRAG